MRGQAKFSSTLTVTVFVLVCFILVSAQNNATASEYIIDTLVVVDDVMYNNWRSRLYPNMAAADQASIAGLMKEYVSLVVHQANKRLATFTRHASYGLKLQVVDVRLNEAILTFVPAGLLSRRINGDVALETFQKWIEAEGLGPQYDHAMLLTGKLMESTYEGANQNFVAGRAYVGTICDAAGRSVSVVHDDGGFQGVYFVAHEAAHGLGALHDGEPGAEACPESDLYLMAPGSQFRTTGGNDVKVENPWYFSPCSVKSISDVIQGVITSNNNCLETTGAPLAEFTSTGSLQAGQVYDATRQCQMMYGPNSALCIGDDFSRLGDICSTMFCAETTSKCVRHVAAEGTSCGNRMWCQMGVCTRSDQAPELGECPYGDTALLLGDRSTCAEYIARSPAACYNDDIRESCCQSCANIHSGSQVCPYGDQRSGCSTDICEHIDPDGIVLPELCCGTCRYNVSRGCEDVSSIDGFTCRERINAYGKQECYNYTVAFYCCQSCAEQRKPVRDCEYGDFVTGSFCSFEARADYSGCTGGLTALCCRTCDPNFQDTTGSDDRDSSSCALSNKLLFFVISIGVLLIQQSICH